MTPEQRRLALRILDAAEAEVVERAGRSVAVVVGQTDDSPTVMSRLARAMGEASEELHIVQAARVAVLQGGGE